MGVAGVGVSLVRGTVGSGEEPRDRFDRENGDRGHLDEEVPVGPGRGKG